MRKSRIGILGLLLVTGLAIAPSLRPLLAQDHDQDHDEMEAEGPLEMAMEHMKQGMRNLGRSLRSPDGTQPALDASHALEKGLIAALSCAPPYPEEVTDAKEQGLYRIAFQRKLAQTFDTTLELESALLKGDNESALALFGKLRVHKKEGHEKFQPEEDDD